MRSRCLISLDVTLIRPHRQFENDRYRTQTSRCRKVFNKEIHEANSRMLENYFSGAKSNQTGYNSRPPLPQFRAVQRSGRLLPPEGSRIRDRHVPAPASTSAKPGKACGKDLLLRDRSEASYHRWFLLREVCLRRNYPPAGQPTVEGRVLPESACQTVADWFPCRSASRLDTRSLHDRGRPVSPCPGPEVAMPTAAPEYESATVCPERPAPPGNRTDGETCGHLPGPGRHWQLVEQTPRRPLGSTP